MIDTEENRRTSTLCEEGGPFFANGVIVAGLTTPVATALKHPGNLQKQQIPGPPNLMFPRRQIRAQFFSSTKIPSQLK